MIDRALIVPASFAGNASVVFFQGLKKIYRGRVLATIDSQIPRDKRPLPFHNTSAADQFFRMLLGPSRFPLPDFRNVGPKEALAIIYDGLLTELESLGYFRIDSSLVPLNSDSSIGDITYATAPTVVTSGQSLNKAFHASMRQAYELGLRTGPRNAELAQLQAALEHSEKKRKALDSKTKQLRDDLQQKGRDIQALKDRARSLESSISSTSAVIEDLRAAQQASKSTLLKKPDSIWDLVESEDEPMEDDAAALQLRDENLRSEVSSLTPSDSSVFQRRVKQTNSEKETQSQTRQEGMEAFCGRRQEIFRWMRSEHDVDIFDDLDHTDTGNGDQARQILEKPVKGAKEPTGYFPMSEFETFHQETESFKSSATPHADTGEQQSYVQTSNKTSNKRKRVHFAIKAEHASQTQER
ncbi:hypothetical protein IWX49DRAFT_633869 [Phyllosticta citricarpa]|uniref:Uncharacterized protein n=2 Tax=Phyllosticta TaxID=121621 RepID=A0ABR1M622_9PEZI